MSRLTATDFTTNGTTPGTIVMGAEPNGPNGSTTESPAAAVADRPKTIKVKGVVDADALKRLRGIEQLGQQIQARKAVRDKQETKVSEVKAKLDEERETFNQLKREVDDMQEDLDKLALGGFAERLPFGKSGRQKAGKSDDGESPTETAAAPSAPQGRAVEPDLQKRFDQAPLLELGITGAMLEKLESDGIRNGKDLQQWFGQYPRRAIKGIGESAVEKINEAMATFFEKAQAELTASKAAAGAPERAFDKSADAAFDANPKESDVVPVAKAMGAKTQPRTKSGKPKRFAGNPKLNKRSKSRK
jgi:hypothetical protein